MIGRRTNSVAAIPPEPVNSIGMRALLLQQKLLRMLEVFSVSYRMQSFCTDSRDCVFGGKLAYRSGGPDGFSLRGNNLFLLQYLLRGPPSGKLNLSLEEAYGAISLGRNNLNVSRRAAGTGFVFISWGTDFLCPTEACIYQATYGATMFRERELQLDLRLFRFSYSIRLVLL